MYEEWPEAERLQYAVWYDASTSGIKRQYELHSNTNNKQYNAHIITKQKYIRTPRIPKLVVRIANYLDRLSPSGIFVENYKKLTWLEITGYWIKYSIVLWLLEHQIRRGRKLQTQMHTVNSNGRTSNAHFSLFSKKNPVT
jgi:uncharacterized sodium:solute symporter family permease YidK